MTNAEKYLKDEVEAKEIWHKYQEFLMNNDKIENTCTFVEFMEEQSKPTLTEDERVILRNIDKKYDLIKRDNNKNLYVQVLKVEDEDDWNFIEPFSHLFQFIKEGEEYEIAELLKGE